MSVWKKYLGAALLSVAGIQAHAASVNAVVTPGSATVGQAVQLDVRIADVTDLYSYEFALSFDPTVLQATESTIGDIFLGYDTRSYSGLIDNTAGTVTLIFNSIYGASLPGVSGSGLLGSISFQTIGAGYSALTIRDTILLDSGSGDIAASINSGSVQVTAVPEPSTYLMLGVGLIGVAALRRRQLAARG
ncbi:cohesin domain-containing protein [Massilia sp. METH4]|uniref:cohesin domain-containing protein n=1 Tax=Massilia sp. METH4 TaxID=3123041 RepID=UPI0030D276EB